MKNYRIDKDTYIGYVNNIIKYNKFIDQSYKLGIDLIEADALVDLECSLTSLLEDATNDKDEGYGSLLTFFLYDLDGGKEWVPGSITDESGNDIKLQTAEDLWDYLESKNDK